MRARVKAQDVVACRRDRHKLLDVDRIAAAEPKKWTLRIAIQMVGGRAHGHRSIDQVGPTNGGQHRRRVELGIEDHRAEAVSVDVSDESSPAPQPRVVEISEMGRVTDDRSPGCHCEARVLNEDQPAARAEESDDLFAGGPVKLGRR